MNPAHSTPKTGRVLVLQGASSAGKSTLAVALQRSLEEHWWVLEADHITDMQATSGRTGWWNPTTEERPHPSWQQDARLANWLAGYWGCLATLARAGIDVIAVGGWLERSWLEGLARSMEGIPAYCVAVHCPIEELERREMARGDRAPGYAKDQVGQVFAFGPLDVEVNTYTQTSSEMVESLRLFLESPPSSTFLARISAEGLSA